MTSIEKRYQAFCETLPESVDVEAAKERLLKQHVETPSWGYGAMGTRFYTLHKPGAPRNVFEKFEDAAQVQKYTGIARSVAIHIPWDKVDDYEELKQHAQSLGLSVGAVYVAKSRIIARLKAEIQGVDAEGVMPPDFLV